MVVSHFHVQQTVSYLYIQQTQNDIDIQFKSCLSSISDSSDVARIKPHVFKFVSYIIISNINISVCVISRSRCMCVSWLPCQEAGGRCVGTFVSLKPPDVSDKTSGQFPAVWRQNQVSQNMTPSSGHVG